MGVALNFGQQWRVAPILPLRAARISTDADLITEDGAAKGKETGVTGRARDWSLGRYSSGITQKGDCLHKWFELVQF
jgi:hypothetical protein